VSSACGAASCSAPEVGPSAHPVAKHTITIHHISSRGAEACLLLQVPLARATRSRRVTVKCFQQQAAPPVTGEAFLHLQQSSKPSESASSMMCSPHAAPSQASSPLPCWPHHKATETPPTQSPAHSRNGAHSKRRQQQHVVSVPCCLSFAGQANKVRISFKLPYRYGTDLVAFRSIGCPFMPQRQTRICAGC
jgi:hypothetical protein